MLLECAESAECRGHIRHLMRGCVDRMCAIRVWWEGVLIGCVKGCVIIRLRCVVTMAISCGHFTEYPSVGGLSRHCRVNQCNIGLSQVKFS